MVENYTFNRNIVSDNWITMKDLMETSPVEISDYNVANELEDETKFEWWVLHTPKKRYQII